MRLIWNVRCKMINLFVKSLMGTSIKLGLKHKIIIIMIMMKLKTRRIYLSYV